MDHILHYDIARTLGEGKNGPSLLAYDSGLQRAVVLKRLVRNHHKEDNWWKSYRKRTEGLTNLNEPSLAAYYGDEVSPEGKLIIREYIEGESFAVMAARGNLDPRRLLQLALGAAEAIRIAHEHGLIHGNISSHNFMASDSQQVVLCDFALEAEATGKDAGDLPVDHFIWQAPEQLVSGQATETADLYSLGLVLRHLVTAQIPPGADSLDQLKFQRAQDIDTPLESIHASRMMHLVLGRLLTADPIDRMATSAELCRTLQEIVVFGEGDHEQSRDSHSKFTPRQYLLITVLVMLLVILWLVITSRPG